MVLEIKGIALVGGWDRSIPVAFLYSEAVLSFVKLTEPSRFVLGLQFHVLPQPRHQLVEVELVGFVETKDKPIRFLGIGGDAGSVDGEEGVGGCECGALVAVDERMVLGHAFPKRGGFLD